MKIKTDIVESLKLFVIRVLLLIAKFCRYFKLNKEFNTGKKKLVLFSISGIGDFVLWLQAARYYRSLFPEYEITLMCNSQYLDLAKEIILFDRVIPFDISDLYRNRWSRFFAWYKMDKSKYDILINDSHSVLFYIPLLINSKLKINSSYDYERKKNDKLRQFSDRHYNIIIASSEYKSLLQQNFAFVTGLLKHYNHTTTISFQPIDDLFHKKLTNQLESDYIVINLGANDLARSWAVERYSQIINHEKLRGYHIVLVGRSNESELADDFIASIGIKLNVTNLVGKTNLFKLFAIIKHAKLCITNDTSTSHIAPALRVKSLVIMGGGQINNAGQGRYTPYPTTILMPAYTQPLAVYSRMECFDCNWQCKYPLVNDRTWRCIDAVTVADVLTKLEDITL